MINRVPVYPGVGNHDTDDTERSDDRQQLADTLFTDMRFAEGAEVGRASVDPGLFYRFSYGADVHFVAIDHCFRSGAVARVATIAPFWGVQSLLAERIAQLSRPAPLHR